MKMVLVFAALLISQLTFAQSEVGHDRRGEGFGESRANFSKQRKRVRSQRPRIVPTPENNCELRASDDWYVGFTDRRRFTEIQAVNVVRDIEIISGSLQDSPTASQILPHALTVKRANGFTARELMGLMREHVTMSEDFRQKKARPEIVNAMLNRLNRFTRGHIFVNDFTREQAACLLSANLGHIVFARAAFLRARY
jgi:hypothetical protein